ncbi:MAG: NUDIX domain-containing protein [Candidatus Micrarchaeota archaeon]|nr:NUDIX domain-containing protein [Candidatus Micrarchaeota archaeon]
MEFQFSAGAFVYMKKGSELRFLLLLKSNGEYDLPKGHIEKGESAEAAAIREIKEETGLTVSLVPFFRAQTQYFFYERKKKVLKRVKFFLAETDTEKVVISYEHKGYEWANYDEAVIKLKFKDLVRLMPVVREYIARLEAIKVINGEYAMLPSKSGSWNLSKRLVPGEGRLDAQIVLLGQAPGRTEDSTGRPFVGRSGMLLTALLKKAGLRRENLYITSAVQFFPPENRIPTDDEIELCHPFLIRQLEVIKPRIVVLLGNVACGAMLGMSEVNQNHGRTVKKDGVDYFITFHPAAALRFKDTHALMEQDFMSLSRSLEEPGDSGAN